MQSLDVCFYKFLESIAMRYGVCEWMMIPCLPSHEKILIVAKPNRRIPQPGNALQFVLIGKSVFLEKFLKDLRN